jgi:hypothetical protein
MITEKETLPYHLEIFIFIIYPLLLLYYQVVQCVQTLIPHILLYD